ncbi:TVP38/TMEM64 family protein [Maricaulis sp.]|uniref:TVP38/TMEM64 family protein n=1 Tax=Maricaulis sp. TaxID=1486257 RepID=UPI002B26EED4|nr:VTT domain-containing protein [Maricaulis sp.]
MPDVANQPPPDPSDGPKSTPRWLRPVVALVLLCFLAALLLTGTGPQEVLTWLRDSGGLTRDVTRQNMLLAALFYTLVYVGLASLALPGALWLTIGAGFLLGPVWAVPVSLAGLTLGAVNTVLLVRFFAGEDRRSRLRARYRRIAAGFERDQLSYVILLRLLPLPYFGVNVAAGLSTVRLWAFVAGTMIGSLPSIILYAGFGAGIGSLSEMDRLPGLEALMQPAVLIPLVMIVPLAVAPLVMRRRARRAKARALSGKSG